MKIFDQIIKFLFQALFFITPLLFLFNTSELFEFNKIIFIYFITTLIAFVWLLKMIVAKKILIKKSLFDIPILLFLFSQIVSTLLSIDYHTSLFGYYGRFNGGLISIFCYIILYYAFISNPIDVNLILKTSLFSSFFVILYAIPGKLGHDITCYLASQGTITDNSCWSKEGNFFDPSNRAFSTLGQPNWFGAYLAINFFIGLYYLLKNKDNLKLLILNTLYLLLNFTFILFSRSRSSLGAVIVSLLLFFIYYLLVIKKDFVKIFLILSISIIIPILFFKTGVERVDKLLTLKFKSNQITPKLSSSVSNQSSNITESFDIRKIVWKGAIDLGLKYPFFGTGVETFAYSYYFVRPVEHNYTSEWDFVYNKAHNEFLNYLATTGFIGLSFYLLLIFSFFYYLIKKLQITNYKLNFNDKKSVIFNLKSSDQIILFLCLASSYITILITNFFGFSTTTINLFFYLLPGFFVSLKDKKEENLIIEKNDNPSRFILAIPFFLIVIYLLFSIYRYWQADSYYSLGQNYLKVSDYQKAVFYFDKALKLRQEPIYQDRLSSGFAYLSVLAAYQKQGQLANQLIKFSDFYNRQTLSQSYQNIFYWKTRLKNQYYFFQATSNKDYLLEGLKAIQSAKKLSPTDPKIPYTASYFYLSLVNQSQDKEEKKNYYDLFLKELNQSLSLKKDYRDALDLLKEAKKNKI